MGVTEPGKAFTMNIVYNALEADYICEEDYPYFLLLCDVYAKMTVLLGMYNKNSETVLLTIRKFFNTYKTTDSELHIGPIESLRGDADPVFMSEEFKMVVWKKE